MTSTIKSVTHVRFMFLYIYLWETDFCERQTFARLSPKQLKSVVSGRSYFGSKGSCRFYYSLYRVMAPAGLQQICAAHHFREGMLFKKKNFTKQKSVLCPSCVSLILMERKNSDLSPQNKDKQNMYCDMLC